MRAFVISLLWVIGACGHARTTRVGIRAGEVMKHLDELGREGRAEIDTVVITRSGRMYPAERENVFLDQNVTSHGATTLLALATGCGPFAANQPCVLTARPDDIIILRTVDPGPPATSTGSVPGDGTSLQPRTNGQNHDVAVVSGALTLATLGGTTLCLILCEEYKAEKSIALGGATLVLAVIWAVASGARD